MHFCCTVMTLEKWTKILNEVIKQSELFKHSHPEMYQSIKDVIKKGVVVFGAVLTAGVYYQLMTGIEQRVRTVCSGTVS